MSNVAHASLTGSQLHEPKGADAAALGTVYVSNGAGSGSWSSVGTSSFTGMIADFVSPVVPTGWLELDGSTINTTTYSALYGTMTIATTGTRSNGSAVITSIPSTSNLKVGYYVFGTGFISGTTIVSVDGVSQITVSNTASSSGSAEALTVSPWLLNTGTIKLPDVSTAGRYRRSRSSTTAVGQVQADQNQAHTHTGSTSSVSLTTDSQGAHTHTVSDPGHTHSISHNAQQQNGGSNVAAGGNPNITNSATATITANSSTTGISLVSGGAHTHSVTGAASLSIASNGGTEARPLSLVVMTCVKT